MDQAAPQPFSVALEKMSSADSAVAGAVGYMVEERGLLDTLVLGIVELVPDANRWRLTITGDMVATVNRLSPRVNSYTTKRGAGEAGAITIRQADGTFDIIISASVLFATREDTGSVEELIAHATAAAAHLSRHEAGHVALQLRGEDSDTFQNVEGLDGAAARWRKMLAAHVDDSRIEQYTAIHAPSPLRNADHVADAIAHLRSELNAAAQMWTADINSAGSRTVIAANNLARVLAYLAPELGLTADGTPRRPDPTPDGWDEYVEDFWDAWSGTFHRLHAANEGMSSAELGDVLVELCQIMIDWMRSIGVEWGIDGNNEYIYWTKVTY